MKTIQRSSQLEPLKASRSILQKILVTSSISFLFSVAAEAQITLIPPPHFAPAPAPAPVRVVRVKPAQAPVTVARSNQINVPQRKITVQQVPVPVVRPGQNQYLATYPYPLLRTPANEAWVRSNDGSVYNNAAIQARNGVSPVPAKVRPGPDLIRLNNDPRNSQTLLAQRPTGTGRYNFQYSNNEVRSVQQALRRLGLYAGATDGNLGAETQGAIEAYQVRNNLPVTGLPSRPLYSQLGIVD